ncbi:MAG: glutamate-1-semialdehyde 2,1-aminomutase, partial [Candidatus Omnitrophica bacterium]|nr:glutamate-1-semialdehyde 2,1-aminomutase [Candidatus Omnitrophota bacterium]
MSALRLARGVTGRKKILKIEGGYHGHADSLLVKAGSGGATLGVPDSLGVPAEFAELTLTIPFNNRKALENVFKKEGKNLAAFILEPVPANMGVIPSEPGYLRFARTLTRKYGVQLIFDEVITGFRLAFGGAQERFGIASDLTCLGKVLGGGLPIAAFGGSAKYMNELAPLGKVYQAGTLSGNPLATSAAIWMLQKLSSKNVYPKLEKTSRDFYSKLRERIEHFRWPIQLNAMGSFFTLFFTPNLVVDFRSAKESNTKRYAKFFHGILEEGVYFSPSQFEANFLSTEHTPQELNRAIRIFERVLRRLF